MDTEHANTAADEHMHAVGKLDRAEGSVRKAQDDLKLIFNSCNLQAPDRKHRIGAGKAPWHDVGVGWRDRVAIGPAADPEEPIGPGGGQ